MLIGSIILGALCEFDMELREGIRMRYSDKDMKAIMIVVNVFAIYVVVLVFLAVLFAVIFAVLFLCGYI